MRGEGGGEKTVFHNTTTKEWWSLIRFGDTTGFMHSVDILSVWSMG